jgi:hypothetical protein
MRCRALAAGGGGIPFYLAANALKPFINNDLAVVISEPIHIAWYHAAPLAQA